MIGRLIFVFALGGALIIAASWNINGLSRKSGPRATHADQVIMTVATESERAPQNSTTPPRGRSSRERLIAQNSFQ